MAPHPGDFLTCASFDTHHPSQTDRSVNRLTPRVHTTASFPRTRSPRVYALTLPCSYNAVGRKKIRIERIADERNRQVTKRPL